MVKQMGVREQKLQPGIKGPLQQQDNSEHLVHRAPRGLQQQRPQFCMVHHQASHGQQEFHCQNLAERMELREHPAMPAIKGPRDLRDNRDHVVPRDHQDHRALHLLFYMARPRGNLGLQESQLLHLQSSHLSKVFMALQVHQDLQVLPELTEIPEHQEPLVKQELSDLQDHLDPLDPPDLQLFPRLSQGHWLGRPLPQI